jgi:hypothetical protein
MIKPGKYEYSKGKSYQVIYFLSCKLKCLECIFANRLSDQLEVNIELY